MSKGRFGIHGGQYVPETIMNAVNELEATYNKYKDDPEFNRELTLKLCSCLLKFRKLCIDCRKNLHVS